MTLRRAQYDAARVTSEPTSLVATADMPGSVTASLAGSAVVGSTLRAGATSLGLPAGATTGLQWRRDGVLTPAKGATYVLTLADRGHRMSVTSTVRAPGFTDLVTTTKDTAVVRLPGVTFAVRSSVSRQRRGGTVLVGARGLVAGETYRVTMAGRSLATGTASSNGKVSRGVTIPRGTPLGRQRLVLTGAQSDRSGSRLIQVLRRG